MLLKFLLDLVWFLSEYCRKKIFLIATSPNILVSIHNSYIGTLQTPRHSKALPMTKLQAPSNITIKQVLQNGNKQFKFGLEYLFTISIYNTNMYVVYRYVVKLHDIHSLYGDKLYERF